MLLYYFQASCWFMALAPKSCRSTPSMPQPQAEKEGKEIANWRTSWGNEKDNSWMRRDNKHMESIQGHDSGISNESEGNWHGDWHRLKLPLLCFSMPSSWYANGINLTTYLELAEQSSCFLLWKGKCTATSLFLAESAFKKLKAWYITSKTTPKTV